MKKFAYVRVSTKEQKVDRQILALKSYDVPEKNIYCDYQSGKNFERPEYKKMLKNLSEGDLLIIKSIDRLGRDYEEILVQWQYITKQIKADILVLDMELLDTRSKKGNLTGMLISDLVLQILAYFAQVEREFIRQRQAEGIEAARKKGKKLGRSQIQMPEEFEKLCLECKERKLTTREAAKKLSLSHTTFYRRYKEYLSNHNMTEIVSKGRLSETPLQA